MKRYFLALALCLACAQSVYADVVEREGKVNSIKMFSDVVAVYVDAVDSACASNHQRVVIKTDHSLFSAVVSTALTAKATGADIQIAYQDQCTYLGNGWDFQHSWLK